MTHPLLLTTNLRTTWCVAVMLLLCSPVQADDGIPALLQFADAWQQQKTPVAASDTTPEKSAATAGTAKPPVQPGPLSDLSAIHRLQQTIQDRERQLSRQQIALREQGQELKRLKAQVRDSATSLTEARTALEKEKVMALPEAGLFRQMLVSVRQALGGTPQEKEAASRIQHLKAQLSGSLKKEHDVQTHLATLTSERDTLKAEMDRKDAALLETAGTLRDTEARLANLQHRGVMPVSAQSLGTPELRLSYAAGSALGTDMLSVVEEREASGMNVARPVLLAGVADAFRGQLQLPQEELVRLLTEDEQVLTETRRKHAEAGRKHDETYIAAFRKQRNVKATPSGFWYRVDYAGEGAIAENDVVDIVLKETLTDGTVIQDMDVAQRVMSQPLQDYPPLFREAIGYLHNHGIMTMVVPPELAYGEKGYPPKVPPGAAMVYELRVNDVKPRGEEQ